MGIISIVGIIILTCILLLVIKFYLLTKLRMRSYVKQGLVEYGYFPFFGIIHEWMNKNTKDCMGQLKHLSYDERFKNKDGIVSNLEDQAFIIFTNPSLINEFLQNQQHYIKYEKPIVGFKQFLGNGITLSEGEEWKSKRKFLSNMFKFDVIVNYLDNIRVITKKMLDRSDAKQFNTQQVLSDLTGAISLSLFIGADIDNYLIEGKNPSSAIDAFSIEIFQHYLHPFAALFGQKVVKMNLRESDRKINEKCLIVRNFMRNILKDTIKREKDNLLMKKQQSYPNLITLILAEGHKLEKEQEIEDFLDIAFNVYFAAKDTTTITLSIFMYYLISHPQYYKRVEEEVLRLPKDYSFNDIQKLDFLQACIKEALRINSTAAIIFTRECINEHKIGKYKINKGTFVNVGLITNQLDSKYFEDPFVYNPDRWFQESTKKTIQENPCAYLPFSGGMRNCIGQHLAHLQSKVIIVEFIRKFKQPTLPKDYTLEMTIIQSYVPKHPMVLELTQRS